MLFEVELAFDELMDNLRPNNDHRIADKMVLTVDGVLCYYVAQHIT